MSINRRFALGIGVSLLAYSSVIGMSYADDPVEVSIAFAYPQLVQETVTEIADRFMELNPGIKIVIESASPDYDELVQRTLRGKIAGSVPDISLHGMHRIRTLVEQDAVVDLTPFLESEDAEALGYSDMALSLAGFDGGVYGIPFSISVPTVFYNVDLVEKAGGSLDPVPQTWDEILKIAKQVDALDDTTQGIFFEYYAQVNNWLYHALVQSVGGQVVSDDNTGIGFNTPEGLRALEILRAIGEAGMVEQTGSQGQQSFNAGTMGIIVTSGARTGGIARASDGKFRFIAGPFPLESSDGTLPAGGMAPMIQTDDPEKQKAAWEFIKFITSPEGQTIMVRNIGYAPSNTIPVTDKSMLGDFYEKNQAHRAHMEAVFDHATTFQTFPGPNSLRIPVNLRDYHRRAFNGEGSLEDIQADMTRETKAMLQE